jgi:hypothetical protein
MRRSSTLPTSIMPLSFLGIHSFGEKKSNSEIGLPEESEDGLDELPSEKTRNKFKRRQSNFSKFINTKILNNQKD